MTEDKQYFCDNEKCINHIEVTMRMIETDKLLRIDPNDPLGYGTIKYDRHHYYNRGDYRSIHLCDSCKRAVEIIKDGI